MSDYQPLNDVAVDRREETVVTQQPGYAATEQVTRDVAAERRLGLIQFTRIIWTILGMLEVLLALRFGLKLIGESEQRLRRVHVWTERAIHRALHRLDLHLAFW